MRRLPLLLILLLPVAHSSAQLVDIQRPLRAPQAPASASAAPVTQAERPFVPLHVTAALNATPEAQQALAEYRLRAASGMLPQARKSADALLTTRDFSVYNFATQRRETINFTLKVQEVQFDIWVETAELATRVTDQKLESLRAALASETPSGSINTGAGIIANNELVFGEPPDADGDGKTDVLLLDIRDNYNPPTQRSAVLGFFSGSDLGGSNPRDIIYLDTYPGVEIDPDAVLQTAAHEYQHLIHARYDGSEVTFINEGLSEFAEVVNGYRARSIDYLQDLAEQRRTLFYWDDNRGKDYQRAGLFMNYVSQRIGMMETGKITQSRLQGASGLESVLNTSGLTLPDIVQGFHAANFVNELSLGAAFGYSVPQYMSVSAAPRTTWDGTAGLSAPTTTFGTLPAGAVDYHVFESVADLRLTLNAPDGLGNPDLVRARLKPITVVTRDDGTSEVVDTPVQTAAHVMAGPYARVVVIVPHVDLAGTPLNLSYELTASWGTYNPGFAQEEVIYDNDRIFVADPAGPIIEAYTFGPGGSSNFEADSRAVNRFNFSAGSVLSSVSVAPLYVNDFGGSEVPDSAPRDYRLTVWPDDGTGFPGASPIFSLDRLDGRAVSFRSSGSDLLYVFDQIDLSSHRNELSGLPATVYIGVENAGADENYLVVPVSEYDPASLASPSFFYMHFSAPPPDWGAFATLRSGDAMPLATRVLPIRATFLVPVADEDEATLPDAFALEPNWPNPFNPATTIAYRMAAPGPARVAVYDLLGRPVAVLVDGVVPAGRHEVRFDAASLASGLYLYALETGGRRATRTMLLIK